MKIEVQNTQDLTLDSKKQIVVYGLPKSGKTRFASTAPSPFFIDFDKGMLVAKGKNIPYITFFPNEQNDPPKTYITAKETIRWLLSSKNDKYDFEYLVLDSTTSLKRIMLRHILSDNNRLYERPTLGDYADLRYTLESFLLEVMNLCMNADKGLIINTHLEMAKDDDLGTITYQPSLIGRLSNEIGVYVDFVFQSAVEETKDGYRYVLKSRERFQQCGARQTIKPIIDNDWNSFLEALKEGEE